MSPRSADKDTNTKLGEMGALRSEVFDLHVYCYMVITYMGRTKVGALCFDLAVLIRFHVMLSTSRTL